MFSARENEQMPRAFDLKNKSEAAFWAWLTEGHILATDLPASSNEARSERKIVVLSNEEIKEKIQDALKTNNRDRLQTLLEIASKSPEGISNDMARKSIRVGSGEYVKLFYVKMLERTSFADVIMKLLFKPCKVKVEELKSKFYGHSFSIANKLDHLMKAIDEWENEKPESRASIAEWGKPLPLGVFPRSPPKRANEWDTFDRPLGEGEQPFSWITPFYPPHLRQTKEQDRLRAAISRYALTDLLIKVAGGDHSEAMGEIFDEFKEDWKQQVVKDFPEQVGLRATIEGQDSHLLFTFYFPVEISFNASRELELFDSYGQEAVKDFVNRILLGGSVLSANRRYEGITNSKEYQNLVDQLGILEEVEQYGSFLVFIGTNVEVPCCRIIVESPKRFAIESILDLPESFTNDEQQFKTMALKLSEKIGQNDFVEHVKDYVSESGTKELTQIQFSFMARKVISEAVSKASSPDDYRVISNLIMIDNKFSGYRTIRDFAEELVESTMRHYSVVSFYINKDLWRLVPLVFKETNWTTLVDKYLKELG
jgi:hypothetical protein